MLTKEREAQIRELSTRGSLANGAQYPGGSLLALQQTLQEIDRLRSEVLRLNYRLADAECGEDEEWEILRSEVLRLTGERDAAQKQLDISRNQTLDAFERVAKEHNEKVELEERLRSQTESATRVTCPICNEAGNLETTMMDEGGHASQYWDECERCNGSGTISQPIPEKETP